MDRAELHFLQQFRPVLWRQDVLVSISVKVCRLRRWGGNWESGLNHMHYPPSSVKYTNTNTIAHQPLRWDAGLLHRIHEQLRGEVVHYKLSKDVFQERVNSYAAQLVQSFCTRDDYFTMTKIIIGGFHICMFFDIASHSKTRTKKWVFRMPIPGEHGEDLLDEKYSIRGSYYEVGISLLAPGYL